MNRFYRVNTRLRNKRDIKKGWLCTRRGGGGGVILGIVDGDMTFGSLNRDAISDQNMPFFIRLYTLVVPFKKRTLFQTIMVKIISVF